MDQPNFTETTCAVPVQALEANTNAVPGKQEWAVRANRY